MSATTLCFAVGASVARAEIPVLCERLAQMLGGQPEGVVVCDVSGLAHADVVAVEVLSRLRMAARRCGWRLVIRGAAPELLALVRLLGLADALPEASGGAAG